MDCKCTTYLDRWKMGPSLLMHALVAAAFLYPSLQAKNANSDAAFHAIAVVFTPQTQIPPAPVSSPQSTTAIPKVTSSTTRTTLDAPATPEKTDALSEPMAIPRYLPKSSCHRKNTTRPRLGNGKSAKKTDMLQRILQSKPIDNYPK